MEASACTFSDLTPDALRAVLRRLQLREVAALSCVCSQLFALCGEEPLWAALCTNWGAAHARSPFDADAARRALRLRSFRSLRRVLHGWRGDPLGVWRMEARDQHGSGDPQHGLVLVGFRNGRLDVTSFHRNVNQHFYALGQWEQHARYLGREHFLEVPRRAGCRTASLQVEHQYVDGFVARVGCDRDDPDVLRCSFDAAPGNFRPSFTVVLRRATGLPAGWSAQPAPGEGRRLQPGLYTAGYGPHGQEIILLRRLAAGTPPEQPLPDGLSLDAPRWEGLKICGDPNVPAGRFTFVAPDVAPSAQVMQDVLADQRPILSFANGPAVPVDLQARGLSAAHAAMGQINEIPGVWDPKWVPQSTLLEYSPDNRPQIVASLAGGLISGILRVAFSMLWGDADRNFAHITDFTPLAPVIYSYMCVEWAQLPPADDGERS